MELKRVGPMSCAKIAGILYGLIGLLAGGMFSLAALIGFAVEPSGETALGGLLFGVGAVIFFPIFYGLIGAVFSAFAALLYNLVAGWVGGIELELV